MAEMNMYDIKDSEIRIIGQQDNYTEPEPEPRKHHLKWGMLLLIILCTALLVFFFWHPRRNAVRSVYRTAPAPEEEDADAHTLMEQRTVDDIPIRLLVPTGGRVEVTVGQLDTTDASILLAAQAADYRADNGKISGAFVYEGELLSRGHPKYGFCAIIGDQMTMGMGRETIFFERAIEQNGYFFRQFSLIHESQFGESMPKGKAIRRALCYRDKQVSIIESDEKESMHDFTQALIDIGIQEAIALVGRINMPLYEDKDGNRIVNDIQHKENIQETYIIWEK